MTQVLSCVCAQYNVVEAGPGDEKHEVLGLLPAVDSGGVTNVPGSDNGEKVAADSAPWAQEGRDEAEETGLAYPPLTVLLEYCGNSEWPIQSLSASMYPRNTMRELTLLNLSSTPCSTAACSMCPRCRS